LTLEQTDKFLSRKAHQIAENLTELKLFNVYLSFDASNHRRSYYFDIRNRGVDRLRRKIRNSSRTAPRKPCTNFGRSLIQNVNNLRAGSSNQQQTEQTSSSVGNLTFPLQKLSINLDRPENNFINLHEAVYVAEIIKFLKLHKNLKDLSINCGKLNHEVSQVISWAVSDLNLKKFKLFCEFSDFYYFFFPKFNPEIEELSLNGILKDEHLEMLIGACTGIKSLELDIKSIIQPKFIEYFSHYLHNLKYLTVKSFITQITATTIFKNVKYLKITNINKESIESAWYDLVMACPNVKELTFLNYKLEHI